MWPAALLASRPMRWPVASGAAAAGLALAALFFSDGSSQSRVFWIGAPAILLAAIGWAWRPVRLPLWGSVFFCSLATFVVWQGVSIAWSIEPSRSWDYTNRGLVYFAFAAVGALVAGTPLRRFAAAACVLPGALSRLRAARAFALPLGVLERAGTARGFVRAAGFVGGRAPARAAGTRGRCAVALRGARRHGPDVLPGWDRAGRCRGVGVALARS